MKVVLKILSKKVKVEKEFAPTTQIKLIKSEIETVYKIPIKYQKILCNSRMANNESTLVSLMGKTKPPLLLVVMGDAPNDKMKTLQIEDIIGSCFCFLSLHHIATCLRVSKTWYKLAVDFTHKNPDRFVFVDKYICYDLLLRKPIYQLPSPIHETMPTMLKMYTQTPDTETELIYYGSPIAFVQNGTSIDCLEVSSSKKLWTVTMEQLKPFSLVESQRQFVQHQVLLLKRQYDEERFNLRIEGREIPEVDTKVIEQQIMKEANEHIKDELIAIEYDRKSKLIFCQFDSFLCVLNPRNGNRERYFDPNEFLLKLGVKSAAGALSFLKQPFSFFGPKTIALPTEKGKRILILDKATLNVKMEKKLDFPFHGCIKQVSTDEGTKYLYFAYPSKQVMVVNNELDVETELQNVTHLSLGNALSHGSVYSFYDSQTVVSHVHRTSKINGHSILMVESPQNGQVEGFFQLAKTESAAKADSKVVVQLCMLHHDYKQQGLKEKKMVRIDTLSLVWQHVTPIPHAHYCYSATQVAELFVLALFVPTKQNNVQQQQDAVDEDMPDAPEEEEEFDESTTTMLQNNASTCTLYLVALDASTGSQKWVQTKPMDFNVTACTVQCLYNCIFVQCKNKSKEVVITFSGYSGKMWQEFPIQHGHHPFSYTTMTK